MGDMMVVVIIGSMLFLPILYYIVRDAVAEGTLRALRDYDKLKNQETKIE